MSTTITLNGIDYTPITDTTPTPTQIVVIEGRWNIVGQVTRTTDGITITNAKVIRYWGTTKGLGELAVNGPTSKTILDPAGTVHVPAHAVILTIDTAASW